MLEASVVVIGDEILGGYVTDENSPWLAHRLQQHAVPLTRIHVVPDELDAIDEALQAELARSRPRLVLTTGGVGSTPDDITYEAVAASLGRGLVEDPTISARIDGALDWTREQGLEVTEEFAWHLKRMARVPEGSRLLAHEAGWAPGVAIDVDGGVEDDGATVVVLPGVPAQLRVIVERTIEPRLLAGRNDVPTVVEIEHGLPESALNITFAELLRRHPGVKLGSYPGDPMLVRLTGLDDEVAAAAALVRDAVAEIESSPAGERLQAAWARRRHGAGREAGETTRTDPRRDEDDG